MRVDCFIGDRFLLTAHGQALSFLGSRAERAARAPVEISRDPAYLRYIFLDELTGEFASVQETISTTTEHLENGAPTAGQLIALRARGWLS